MLDRAPDGGLVARYDAAAGGWHDAITRLGYPAAYRRLLGTEPWPAAARVVDVGAGSGLLAETWVEVAGVPGALTLLDPSRDMLARAEARLSALGVGARLMPEGIGSAAVAAGGADVVLAAHVIEHLRAPDEALRWMRGRLCPGGRLFLAVSRPHWCTAILRWTWGHKAYRPQEMSAMLGAAGFTDVEVVPFVSGPPSRTSMGYRARRPL